MPGEKFIAHNGNGGFREVESVQTGSTSAAAEKIPSLDINGRLDTSMMPSGIGADTSGIETSESLSAGDFVNVYENAGSTYVRKADATSVGKEAHGFVKASSTNGSTSTVYFEGNNDAVSGVTGGTVYLSTTAGSFTSTAPNNSGNIVQKIGVGTSSTNINFDAHLPIVLS